MTKINENTKKAQAMIWEWNNCFKGRTIEDAYERPSSSKVATFYEIARRAMATDGYNFDFKVTGGGCHYYSTMYTFTTEEGTFLVKDTYANTYILKIA